MIPWSDVYYDFEVYAWGLVCHDEAASWRGCVAHGAGYLEKLKGVPTLALANPTSPVSHDACFTILFMLKDNR